MTDVSAVVDGMIEDMIRRDGGFLDRPVHRGGPTNSESPRRP